MTAAPVPTAPQVPSQETSHGDLGIGPFGAESGSIHSAIKSANIYDFIALRFSKSMTYSKTSITHLLILPELSLLPNISFSG
jgi:hypothetical protein